MCTLGDFRELAVKSVGEPDARNGHVRKASYAAHSEATDPGPVGVYERGIIVLFAEVSQDETVHLWRADLPVKIEASANQEFRWAVEPPSIRPIISGDISERIIYFHHPEARLEVHFEPPHDDSLAAKGLEGIIAAQSSEFIGGDTRVVRMVRAHSPLRLPQHPQSFHAFAGVLSATRSSSGKAKPRNIRR